MDPRTFALCLLLACAPTDGGVTDAGVPSNLTLSASPTTVVRGETTSVRVIVTNSLGPPGQATISFGPLPSGVTSSVVTWQGESTIALDLTATNDAAQGTVQVAIQAAAQGNIIASTTVPLSVSNLDGSLDPKFGSAGLIALPLSTKVELAGLASQPDGGWLIGAYDGSSSIILLRLTAAGVLDSSFGTGGMRVTQTSSFNTASPMAVSADGHVAFDAGSSILTFDASGKPGPTLNGISGNLLAFDGTGFFTLVGATIRHIDSNGTVVTQTLDFNPSAIRSATSGALLMSGEQGSDLIVEKALFDGQSLALDPSFGSGGIALTPNDGTAVALGLDIDGSGRPIVALSSQDAISLDAFSSAGVLDSTFGGSIALQSAGAEAISVIASGASLFVGGWDLPTTDHHIVLARFDAQGNIKSTFGTYGLTTTNFGDFAPTAFAMNQAGNRICTIGTSALSSFAHFMACYRIEP